MQELTCGDFLQFLLWFLELFALAPDNQVSWVKLMADHLGYVLQPKIFQSKMNKFYH